MCLLGSLLFVTKRVNGLDVEKRKKSLTDLVIERAIDLFGSTPDERSDENLKWMRENGYRIEKRHKRGRRGRTRPNEAVLGR